MNSNVHTFTRSNMPARAFTHIHTYALWRNLLSISIGYTLLVYYLFMVLQGTWDLFWGRDFFIFHFHAILTPS